MSLLVIMHLVYNVKYAYLCVYLIKEIKNSSFLKNLCESLCFGAFEELMLAD